ncbi:MAG: hypothetical protein GY943_32900 [Chloroflexi bacterium]|nr:hypothetical protein [Chloroflexota bacterium]
MINQRDFFVAGGTLRSDAPSYVARSADAELYRLALVGTLCYVLTTRQMGKSSLMNRVGAQLKQAGVQTALIDLTSIGTATIDEWYLSLLDDLQMQLDLHTDAEAWWLANGSISPVKRFTKFILDVVQRECDGAVAIFIDEVDSALKLPFSDDFFAAVRAIYNTPSLDKPMSFVLLGVAAPNELIKDPRRTPFNVGERIELEELALADAQTVFGKGLPQAALIARIFEWTSGHPYLTQRIGQAIVRDSAQEWTNDAVDELVSRLFLTEQAQRKDSNLQFVNGRITTSRRKTQLLHLYKQIYSGKKQIRNDERAETHTELKLYGLVKVDAEGNLAVRNQIYRQAFNQQWIQQQMPPNNRRIWMMLLAFIAVVAIGFSIYFWQQSQRTDELLAETAVANFQSTTNPTLRLDNLAQLLALPDYEAQAVMLFHGLTTAEQVSLITDSTSDLQPQIEAVVDGVYQTLGVEDVTQQAENTQLLAAMSSTLNQFETSQYPTLPAELESWLQGRTAVLRENYDTARISYSVALSLNETNPATRYERAQVALLLQDDEAALADLVTLNELGDAWSERVAQIVARTPRIHSLVLQSGTSLADLVEIEPTPTPIPPTSSRAEVSTVPVPSQTPLQPTATVVVTPTTAVAPINDDLLDIPQTDPTGIIAYTCFVENVDQICVINADGTDQRQLTENGRTNWYPSFGTTQETILFSTLRTGVFSLFQIDLSGDVTGPLVQTTGGDYAPALSPDGSQIVFARAENGSQNVWVMDVGGGGERPLTRINGDALDPVWSPDGQQIAFARRLEGEAGYTHVIMNADGSEQRVLQTGIELEGGRSDWSLDNNWLAIYAGQPNDRDIYLIAIDGSDVRRLTFTGDNLAPSFSPDGNWIVFTSARDGDNELYVMRLDGSGLTQLTQNETADWQPRWGR